ncbi:MAG TPA: PAS domain S-box protein [Noviherbaspirillum sp.]|uniref:sensor domain-containing diguanylate cyclase n=1 Tax=Noviherbaspirillum sp. TaxID=1926288 RepID=UPI002B484491|nr:PAS domain S-box protein [Noviherbaspirillum sp.]HJV83831.1 PAS domain S-box protein [Noviherbaspirillum sp.]
MQDILKSRSEADRELLRAMLWTMQDCVIVIDERGTVEAMNPATEKVFGFAATELIGRNISVLMPSPHRESHDSYLERYLRTGERRLLGMAREFVGQRKDGTHFPIELMVTEMVVGGRRRFTGVIRDISARKHADEAQKKSRQELDLALDGADVYLWHLDCNARTMHCFDRLPQAIGLRPEEVRPELEFWLSLIHPDDRAEILHCLAEVGHAPPGPMDREIRLRGSDGDWKWMYVRAQVVQRDSAGMPLRVAGTCLDITRRKHAEEKMLLLAQHDALTGLPNRALTIALGEQVLAAARRDRLRCAVLFVDLDRFKPINDAYGHEAGDAVLQEVARRLTGCIRAGGVAMRRGDREALYLSGTGAEHFVEHRRQPVPVRRRRHRHPAQACRCGDVPCQRMRAR